MRVLILENDSLYKNDIEKILLKQFSDAEIITVDNIVVAKYELENLYENNKTLDIFCIDTMMRHYCLYSNRESDDGKLTGLLFLRDILSKLKQMEKGKPSILIISGYDKFAIKKFIEDNDMTMYSIELVDKGAGPHFSDLEKELKNVLQTIGLRGDIK